MIDSPQPRIHNGSMTFHNALTFVFENTPYSFNIVDPFTAERFENFGRENALSLFQTIIERYGAEYTVAGNTVTLRKQRGGRADFAWRYGVNVKTLDKQIESHNIATAIEGYGGDPDEDGNYPIRETYISPHADLYPELRWADPVVNENLSTVAGMRARLQRVLIDEPQISVTIDFADLRAAGYTADVPNEGDWGYIIYEPMDDFKAEARIVEIVEEMDANDRVIKCNVTLSNIRRKLTDVMTRFSKTSKQIDKLFAGQAKLPYNVLDDAVKLATQALQSAQTELKFENGITAVDKTNANNLVLFNSAGIGISDDGGATFKTAMTGHGIVADVITAGQLNANNVTIYGGSRTNYTNIQGNMIEARGVHERTWFGVTETHDTRIRTQWGYMIAENMDKDRRLYYSDFGISTYLFGGTDEDDDYNGSGVLEFFSHEYNPDVRGVTMSSNRGIVALKARTRDVVLDGNSNVNILAGDGVVRFRPRGLSRPGRNFFEMNVKDGANASLTDGWIAFGNPDNGFSSGLRFDKDSATLHATNGNGDFWSGDFEARRVKALDYFEGSLYAPDTHLYAMVDGSNGEFRVTNRSGFNGGNVSYRDLAARDIRANAIRANDTTHLYMMVNGTVGGEIRATNLGNTGYRPVRASDYFGNSIVSHTIDDFYIGVASGAEAKVTTRSLGGSPVYRPIRAAEFLEASSITYKQNIEPLDYEVLPLVRGIEVKQYNLNSDVDAGIYHNKQVGLIAELTPEVATQDGKAVNLYKLTSYNTKAIQELADKIEQLTEVIENGTG